MKTDSGWPLALIGLVVVAAFVGAETAGVLWRVDSLLQDSFFTWRRAAPSAPVTLVEVDTQTLNTLGWPLSRAYHANLLLYLSRHGAHSVGYDVLLSESREEVQDAALAMAAAQVPVCFTFSLPVTESPAEAPDVVVPPVVAAQSFPLAPGGAFRAAFAVEEVPYEALRESAVLLGHATVLTDPDGLIRSVPLFLDFAGRGYPALSFQLYTLWRSVDREHIQITDKGVTIETTGGHAEVPLSRDGQLPINWLRGASVFPSYSMLQVLADDRREADGLEPRLADAFAGRAVIVGVTAEALRDSPPTPLGPKTPGCMIHAQALWTLVSGRFLRRVPWWSWVLGALVLLPGVAWVAGKLGSLRAGVATLAVVGATVVGGWQLFLRAGALAPVAGLMIAEALSYAVASGYERFRKEKEGRQVKAMFGKYVAPEVLNELLERPGEVLSLGGTRKELSVVFCDVKGFSALCEKVDPPEFVAQLNEYLGEMTESVFRFRGTVDKFMGDAVMAFFGHPLECDEHAERAVLAALEMQKTMQKLQQQWSARGKPALHIRVGVHSGTALVGNMGSKRRLDYTVFGPTVNLAQRLETCCEPDGVLVSEHTLRRARNVVKVVETKMVEAKNIGVVKAYQVAAREEP